MTEYIDRQAAIEAACKGFCHPGVRCPDVECREQTKFIREIPAADVVPVVHGEWIPQDHNKRIGCATTAVFYYPKCSACGHNGNYDMHYCPYCGARMDGERRKE